jgi:hypothetical protein
MAATAAILEFVSVNYLTKQVKPRGKIKEVIFLRFALGFAQELQVLTAPLQTTFRLHGEVTTVGPSLRGEEGDGSTSKKRARIELRVTTI